MILNKADQNKFEQLYCNYHDLMFYRARKILDLDDYLAEDAVNEAFLRIAQNISKVEEAVSPHTKALVMRIVENTAIDMYRKRKREQGYTVALSEVENLTVSQPDEPWTESALKEALMRLPSSKRQVVYYKCIYGYGNKEIAELLNYTMANVEKLFNRSKKQLDQFLQENM